MLLQVSHIKKSFDGIDVLKDVNLNINENDKTALVGVNGCGKSTLLKIIIGEEEAEDGSVILKKDTQFGYVAQTQEYSSDKTIYEEMLDAKKEIIELEEEINNLHEKMDELTKNSSGETSSELSSLIKKADELRYQFESKNGYAYKSEIVGVLKGLGFTEKDYDRSVSELSGGEKTRVALGKMLALAPELIILDEPTNHLDMNSIAWLEGFLNSYPGTVLLVSHDRYFLDKIVNNVVEISNGESIAFKGNYSDFSAKKQAYLAARMNEYLNQQREIKHQEEVITKLKQFNREKSIKRAESREKQLNKIERIDKPIEENRDMHLRFHPAFEGGNDVLTVENLSKAFENKELFRDVSFELKKGERVAIIGDNGTGKTTILKIINDYLDADAGSISLGSDIYIGYYDQAQQVLHDEKSIFDEIHDDYPAMTNTEVRNLLAAFLFTEDDVFKLVGDLSGGEKGRVSLAKLMLSDANLLILDEPTNHLDIDSKEILESALREFTGTVLFVSHDRYFINKTATRILELTNKDLLSYIGNYDYYIEKRDTIHDAWIKMNPERAAEQAVNSNNQGQAVNSGSAADSNASSSNNALSFKEQKELKNKKQRIQKALNDVENKIQETEEKLEEISAFLNNPDNGNDAAGLLKATRDEEAANKTLEELMESWEDLSTQLSELE